jgi:hypothetical protein
MFLARECRGFNGRRQLRGQGPPFLRKDTTVEVRKLCTAMKSTRAPVAVGFHITTAGAFSAAWLLGLALLMPISRSLPHPQQLCKNPAN